MYKDSSCRSSPQPPPLTPTTTPASYDRPNINEAPTGALHAATKIQSYNQLGKTFTTVDTGKHDEDYAFGCSSESNSDSEYASLSRPSTNSTTSTSSGEPSSQTAGPIRKGRRARCDINSDVRLLRKIGYIASRLQLLAKSFGDFKLVNPYSPAKQRKQLQEIKLKHSIQSSSALEKSGVTVQVSHGPTPESSISSSTCGLPTEDSYEDETVTSSTVRRKSSGASTSASILLLEELLVKFYEDRSKKLTVIRRRYSRKHSGQNKSEVATTLSASANPCQNHLIIMSGKTDSKSVERLLPQSIDNDEDGSNASGSSVKASNFLNSNASSSQQHQIQQQQKPDMHNKLFLQPMSTAGDDSMRRRRASDCSTHPGLSSQLQITLKKNNCAKFPFHRGSCGAAGEHLLAANSIANRATIILSKSCGNVDGGSNGAKTTATFTSNDLRHIASGNFIGTGGTKTATFAGSTVGTTSGNANLGSGFIGPASSNEYSIVQLNNTIIQCHFNDEHFRALVKELKRKVEYTERMNWLCLSKRPMAPPRRKSSLPKHQEVKRRFLEICDTTFSDEVKAALRLPAFDSYAWSDADVIHLMQTMFNELGFVAKFGIPNDTLREWLYEVYKHYNEVPFHNFRHCFCVAQMMYAITRQANLLQRLGDLECLILLVSCICHDLDHPGYNNIYQINARTELALRYNDISPLENHHCSIAFRLLEHPDCNIFKNFNRESFNHIREGIIRCILATDMARHNEILTQFKEITPIFDYCNRAHINLLCMVLIKVADISNEARPMDVAEPWLDRLLQEFFAQSAAEKSEGLPVTPFMDPDKVSRTGSQVRFIGLVLLPLFEALGELLPEITELIILPVRFALDYYKRLNDAQIKSRKSVAESGSVAASENNSAASDGTSISYAAGNAGTAGAPSNTNGVGGNNCGGSTSPQMPRSQSGISVKSRRSIPSQKSASRTSVDEPQCLAAELHDLPEGSESGDSETATEVDVAEKTSKFKVDTEGSSNRSKSSHSTSRKSSREKRPSMIGEMCSSGSGQRARNSYGNIHGYHGQNRGHFGSNRAVSLDQYSTNNNNRRLSDGLQQVISDSNVFYNRHNRGSIEATGDAITSSRLGDDLNMNMTCTAAQVATLQLHTSSILPNMEFATHAESASHGSIAQGHVGSVINGNLSPSQASKQQCCSAGSFSMSASNNTSNGMSGNGDNAPTSTSKSSWRARLKQFSDYFSFSFDKNAKRFGSTRSSPSSVRNNNSTIQTCDQANVIIDPTKCKSGGVICCTISNNVQPSVMLQHRPPQLQHELLGGAGRNRAYSLDVPPFHRSGAGVSPRYSSSSGGGGDSSRKSSSKNEVGGVGEENNSNNTLHSCTGAGSDVPPIRIGSLDVSDTIHIAPGGLQRVITPGNLAEAEQTSLSIDLGLVSGGSSSTTEPSKI